MLLYSMSQCLHHFGTTFPQDLTLLLKNALDLKDACIFNPGIVHLSEKDGTLLMGFRTYSGKNKGMPCVMAKASRPLINAPCLDTLAKDSLGTLDILCLIL